MTAAAAAAPLERVRRVERIEADAYRALIAAAPPAFAAAVGLRAVEIAGVTLLVAPRIPVPLFNRAIGLGVHQPASEGDVDAILDVYRDAGVAEAWLHRCPDAEPAALESWLSARGLRVARRPTWAKVAIDAAALPDAVLNPAQHPHLVVREIGPDDAPRFAELVTRAHGMPPGMIPWTAALVGAPHLRSYLVERGGESIGAGLLYVGAGGAWLGLGATADAHRRQGAQGALLVRRVRDALEAGSTLVTTETGEPVGDEDNPSLRNMYRHGFERVYARWNHATA